MNVRKSFANRKFYSLPENPNRASKNKFSGACRKREDIAKLVKYIDDNVIGKNTTFVGPYGRRKVVYCDYASSGRSLQFIEDYIVREVLPNFGNAHSTASITSLQSALFRHEAKEIFRICVNATEDDTVIFAGHGCRGAICKLLQELDFQCPPVVFMGPCEHQSALLPWKELGAKVVRISESKEGFLDLDDLETQLLAHEGCGAQLIGCFSAANNITGILADDVATTLLLHQHGALAFWDYSTAAPYVQLDMNPTLPGVEESAVHKDVIFFSAHKFIGGAQTPGILIAKKSIFKNSVPSVCSPIFEDKGIERYVADIDLHDDRGTATIVEDVRAGLVMHLKEAVSVPAIMTREEKITRTVLAHVKNVPEFILLGNSSHSLKRLPFFSFIVRHPRGMFLHHNFVCSVLNDVFGIQARAGCASAGPYSQDFMGIDMKLAEEYEKILLRHSTCEGSQGGDGYSGLEILRPGFTRISLPFCISDAELGFILEALKMVATEGWKLLPQYVLKPETGEWRHHSNSIFRDRKWLMSLKYVDGRLVIPERKVSSQGTCPSDYEECLHVARCIFNRARKMVHRYPPTAQKFSFDKEAEILRWFMLPSEAHDLLIGNSQNVKLKVPFDPFRFKGCRGDPLEVNTYLCEKVLNKCASPTSASSPVEQKNVSNVPNESECKSENASSAPGVCISPPKIQTNFVPNISNYLLPERQNSSSSEPLSCDYIDYSGCQSQFFPNPVPYVLNSQSPAMNSLDVFSYSPQSMMPSPLPNQMDLNTQPCFNPQSNYLSMHPSNYLTNYNCNGYDTPQCQDQVQSGVKPMSYGQRSPKSEYHPVNKVHFLLGANETSSRQRCNSLGSSLVVNPKTRANLGYSCRSLTDGETSLNLSECSLSSNEDIHAYVTEVTKELATEIKSEIREVISKVEDVLSESVDADAPNYYSEHRGSRCFDKLERTNSLPSASANDIAQYLMGVSKEMAEEMKSEIRGLVNSVVSPESSPMLDKKAKRVTIEAQAKEKVDIKGKKVELSGENISQSRDSGINLSYSETVADSQVKDRDASDDAEKSNGSAASKRDRSESLDSFQENNRMLRCRSESLDSLQENDDSDAAAKSQVPRRKISRATKKMEKCFPKNLFSGESSNDEGPNTEDSVKPRWYCPSKAVWKPTVEALKEFEMIKNGDKILVCLSGGKNSLAILHTLQQYRFYASSRGIHFEMGAVTFDPSCENPSARSLIPYLKKLGIPYYYEEQCARDKGTQPEVSAVCSLCWKMKRSRLYAIARKRNYNVVALGQTLDDLAESFLMSAFHNGRLRSMKAHYYVTDKDIRVIRPFVYVREKALRQFVEGRNLPAVPENCPACKNTSKERQRSKQLLSHQESVFPRLFNSLKAALHPLINCRNTEYNVASTEYTCPHFSQIFEGAKISSAPESTTGAKVRVNEMNQSGDTQSKRAKV